MLKYYYHFIRFNFYKLITNKKDHWKYNFHLSNMKKFPRSYGWINHK